MKHQVSLKTSEFRGDHAADINIGLEVPENTTVEELVQMVFMGTKFSSNSQSDVIEIRISNPINPTTNE